MTSNSSVIPDVKVQNAGIDTQVILNEPFVALDHRRSLGYQISKIRQDLDATIQIIG